MHITFIQTGGTIDKNYPRSDANHGYGFEIGSPAFEAILPKVHAMFTYDIVSVAKKDSLDLTDEDRKAIVDAVVAAQSDKVVITHGTDTMTMTADVLAAAIKNKTIVLTGAMLPEKFKDSDAWFNVGMAVSAVQTLQPGVYVALYGRVVPWNEFKQLNADYEAKAKGV